MQNARVAKAPMMDDQLMIRWRRGETSFKLVFFIKNSEFFFFYYTMFLELCKDFVYFLSSESDLIGVCSCFSREAGAKWAFLCYNERSIKNGEKRVNRKLQTRFCGGSSL